MNYFIYYNKYPIAYTTEKKFKNDFISQFKYGDNIKVDKMKKLPDGFKKDQLLEDLTLYFNSDMGTFTNDFLDGEVYSFIQDNIDALITNVDRLGNIVDLIRMSDEERYVVTQALLHHGVHLEDSETQYHSNINVGLLLELEIIPLLINTPI